MFKKIILLAVFSLVVFTPAFVSAQGLKDAGSILGKIANPSQTGLSGDLAGSVATVIKAILALVGTVFLILTIYAGILWMTAQGEESKVEKAKEIIKASVIGLIIITSAYAITFFVTSKLVTGGGNETNNVAICSDAGGTCKTTCGSNESAFAQAFECPPQSCCVAD